MSVGTAPHRNDQEVTKQSRNISMVNGQKRIEFAAMGVKGRRGLIKCGRCFRPQGEVAAENMSGGGCGRE